MPAFDPVRDAVLNSPVTSSLALPAAARAHGTDASPARPPSQSQVHAPSQPHPYPHLHSQPHLAHPHPLPLPHGHPAARGPGMSIVTSPTASPSDTGPAAAAALVSPLTRRATDLSMLLNSDPAPGAADTPLFTPTTPRAPATLSHLLHDPDAGPDVEQLSHFMPLRRRASATRSPGAAREREPRDVSYFSHPGSTSHARRPSSSASASSSASVSAAAPSTLIDRKSVV